MKKFFVKIFVVLLLVAACSFMVGKLIPRIKLTDWSWGSETINKKKSFLHHEQGKFNTLFIGSSHVYRQISPVLFDSTIHFSEPVHSYNFGADWMGVQESNYVFEKLMKDDDVKWKYAIIELTKIKSIDYANLHTTRVIYWMNASDLLVAIKSVWASSFSLPEKMATTSTCMLSYADRLLNLGYFTEAFSFKTVRSNFSKADSLCFMKDGFMPYRSVSARDTGSEAVKNRNAHSQFLADTSVVFNRKVVSESAFRKMEEHPELNKKLNRPFLNELQAMILNAQNRGVQLIFLLPPRVDRNQYKELLPVFNALPAKNKVELSDARKYPELYTAAFSFDATHLNSDGASLFTKLLAKKCELLFNL